MHFVTTAAWAIFAAASVQAAPQPAQTKLEERDGILYNVFEDLATGAKLSYVENSGVCETTPGVRQVSGYLSVGTDANMFFWFFGARKNSKTAPLSTWFNGGPGCSSMIGLFQENGPCHFVGNDTEPTLNPYSFNEYANMLYVDQPIGVGFSYGTDTVTSTTTAAPMVWKLLQAFFKTFPHYENREFAIFTESYGGHYGPEFADYIESQNKAITSGSVSGEKVNLIALGINNGIYDNTIQQKAYITYALTNKYNQIINSSRAAYYTNEYNTKCKPALALCNTTDSALYDVQCAAATEACFETVEGPITQEKDFDVYDVRQPSADPYPPNNYLAYLNRADVQKKIGAKAGTDFQDCSNTAGVGFATTGDESRSFLPTLSRVVQSGIRVLIWAGDADFICNYIGGFEVVQKVEYAQQAAFRALKLSSYKVSGKAGGLFKTAGNLSWLQVYGAGHEVPYYTPKLALQAFKQTMMKKPLSST